MKRFIKSILVVLIIVGFFNPYIGDTIPLEYLLIDTLETLPKIAGYIAVANLLLYLFVLLYQHLVEKMLWLQMIGPLLIGLVVMFIHHLQFVSYFYLFEDELSFLWSDFFIVLGSIVFLVLTFLLFKTKFQLIENAILTTLLLPIAYYFFSYYWFSNFDLNWQFGFYLINISFGILLLLATFQLLKSCYNYLVRKGFFE